MIVIISVIVILFFVVITIVMIMMITMMMMMNIIIITMIMIVCFFDLPLFQIMMNIMIITMIRILFCFSSLTYHYSRYINHNKLEYVAPNSFERMMYLDDLWLHRNRLAEIPTAALQPLSTLTRLYLFLPYFLMCYFIQE